MNNEKIMKLAQEFGLPVFDKRVYETELKKDFNYIVIRPGGVYKKDCKLYRRISINYIYDGLQKISDSEIIKRFDRPGFKFEEMKYDDFRMANLDKWLDMNSYYFIRCENYEQE